MRYLSVCSGIEAASCAWHPLGWTPVAFSEIEKFPSAVLAHHYPGVPNWGDMTKFKEWPNACVCVRLGTERQAEGHRAGHAGLRASGDSDAPSCCGNYSIGMEHVCEKCGGATIDLLVGGTPCQSFSVAGLRKGLADPRGNLALTYLALADRYRPEWLVWENVPGVLSADKGEAFGAFLGGLGELGYGWAYRVLDAQYFGLAQRRKRVFVVASARGWQRAAAVLFDAASLRGDSAPSRAAGQGSTASLRTRAPGSGGQGTDWEHTVAHALAARAGSALCAPDIQTYLPTMLGQVAPCLDAMMDRKWGSNQWVDSGQFVMCASDGQASASVHDDQAPYLTGTNEQPYVALGVAPTIPSRPTGGGGLGTDFDCDGGLVPEVVGTLSDGARIRAEGFDASEDGTGRGTPYIANVAASIGQRMRGQDDSCADNLQVAAAMQVRRLTPRECERLQGFADDYTLIPYRGKPAADGPRYKALGNSMAVPVMHWIGQRIQQVSDIQEAEAIA